MSTHDIRRRPDGVSQPTGSIERTAATTLDDIVQLIRAQEVELRRRDIRHPAIFGSMARSDRERIDDILIAIADIRVDTAGMDYAAFSRNPVVIRLEDIRHGSWRPGP
ncbi:hypothetical protein JL100_002555 [Skermanella mucosa]|uniref:hypothetical protein n=1 Tax=Skermanella mucosa TaxID=1789672 RepID=UPI001E29CA3A|nr:hypothetical protein [Skermanella mucosa]UEM21672.1 hypothetical protein JL100_002555 [Skermanella mucosa]